MLQLESLASADIVTSILRYAVMRNHKYLFFLCRCLTGEFYEEYASDEKVKAMRAELFKMINSGEEMPGLVLMGMLVYNLTENEKVCMCTWNPDPCQKRRITRDVPGREFSLCLSTNYTDANICVSFLKQTDGS